MKKVYFTCGPRGSGKTTWSKKMSQTDSRFAHIERDAITLEMYGKRHICPYNETFDPVYTEMYKRVSNAVKRGCDVIMDCWNELPKERQDIVKSLSDLKVSEIIALYFFVDLETNLLWRSKKDDDLYFGDISIKYDHELFYREARDMDQQLSGIPFDDFEKGTDSPSFTYRPHRVIKVAPSELDLFLGL